MTISTTHRRVDLVSAAERVGMTISEWNAIRTSAPDYRASQSATSSCEMQPPTPEEWREAMLSTVDGLRR